MKKAILFCVIFFSAISAFPQWRWQNPLPCGNPLESLCFTSSTTGYAVGDAGTILKTTDGGLNWTVFNKGPEYYLYSVCFTDENTGYAAGSNFDGCTILKTVDAGASWNSVYGGTGGGFTSICFPDFNTGYAMDRIGDIVKTTDGGLTWTRHPIVPVLPYLNSVFFTSVNTGYVAGYNGRGVIIKTINGGETWDTLSCAVKTSLTSVFFTDSTTGYVVGGNGTILKTINAGVTWAMDTTGLGNLGVWDDFQSIFFTDANTGYVAGPNYGNNSGKILKTVNAGTTWAVIPTGITSGFNAVFFPDADTGYALSATTIFKTTNAGLNWSSLSKGTAQPNMTSVFFPDSATGYAVGTPMGNYPSVYLKTTNGGRNWTSLPNAPGFMVNSVFFTDNHTGYVVDFNGHIYKTKNGGNNWSTLSSGTTYPLYSVFFLDANTGFIAGGDPYNMTNPGGIILKTTDAGVTWTKTVLPYVLNSVYFPDPGTGYAVGYKLTDHSGAVIKTTDGGATWNFIARLGNSPLYSVFFTDSITGFVVGTYLISRTKDGGATWGGGGVGGGYGGRGVCKSVYFPTPNKGYVVDDQGGILKTNDGGNNWSYDSSGTINPLSAVFFTDSLTGYVVGENGTILKTGYGGEPYLAVSPAARVVGPKAGITSFPVTSNTGWDVISDSSWCAVTYSGSGNDTIFVSYSANTSVTPRVDTIRVFILQQPPVLRKVTVTQEGVNGIGNIGYNAFLIYPNPATGKIAIKDNRNQFNDKVVSIYSMTGELVKYDQFRNGHQVEIDVSDLVHGIYVVKVQTDSEIAVQKLVIQ